MSTNQSLPLSSTHIHSPTTLSSSTSSTFPHAPVPTEIEATLSRLSAYRNVRGAMILSRRSGEAGGEDNRKGGIIQSIGAIFEGEGGRRYAKALEGVVASVGGAVGECDEGVSGEARKLLQTS